MESLLSPPPPLLDHYSSVHNLQTDEDKLFTNQILDIIFESKANEQLGFGVKVDDSKNILQINSVDHEGEAYRVGLKCGDIVIAVNDTDIGKKPQIGLEELKRAKSIGQTTNIRITIVRRIFTHIMLVISRAGITNCNGKYYFRELDDEYDSPIFEHQNNNMILCKANYDIDTGESLWTISDQSNNYYIGVSVDLMPPNDSWNPIKKIGKYPCPGVVFYNTEQRLVDVESDKSDETAQNTVEYESDSEDELIEVNYANYAQNVGNKKRMSQLQFNALNDPSMLLHAGEVFEHLNVLNEEKTQNEIDVQFANDISEEWKQKYNDLLARFKESERTVQVLRGNLKDLNTGFYEYWLRDKTAEKERQKLEDRVWEQNQELFEQNKNEIRFITQIKEKRKESKINSLVDIDLDELFKSDGNCQLEIEACLCQWNIASENVLSEVIEENEENEILINELRQKINMLERENFGLYGQINVSNGTGNESEINALKEENESLKKENGKIETIIHEINNLKQQNLEMSGLFQEIESLKSENGRIEGLCDEIENLKEMNAGMEQKSAEFQDRNDRLQRKVTDLGRENGLIIDSKLKLIDTTNGEIDKLKNIINTLLISNANHNVITKMLLCK